MTAVVPPAVWVHGRDVSWMIVHLDAGVYLSLEVSPGAGTPNPWSYLVELCGPEDEVLDRRTGRSRNALHARAQAVKVARELRVAASNSL
ncbi:hypothetical protein SEA_CLOWN_89 [Gordonia phage Clown]|uniref:Uncharacterized protein n=1 Tax=Gordonia phage Clown TaxID=2759393 RepID=A0A7L7SPL3_9CAUD|nr:hypothetical protein KNV25_gp89 [Gordonia phage Clown]QOC56087.1 hypothetical protein SEA_CLOWN_89 [Gordonia phage Clown]